MAWYLHFPGQEFSERPWRKETFMLTWAVIFFIIAIIAAVFGFGGIAGAATSIAKIIFFIFLVLLVISLIAHAVRGRPPI